MPSNRSCVPYSSSIIHVISASKLPWHCPPILGRLGPVPPIVGQRCYVCSGPFAQSESLGCICIVSFRKWSGLNSPKGWTKKMRRGKQQRSKCDSSLGIGWWLLLEVVRALVLQAHGAPLDSVYPDFSPPQYHGEILFLSWGSRI